MKRLTSRVGLLLASLYALVALLLFYNAWNCATMLCDLILGVFTFPTFAITKFLFGLINMGEPSIAHIHGLESTLDVIGVSFNILGNCVLVYLVGLALERIATFTLRQIRQR